MGDVVLDSFLDSLKILPFLLVMNFLIEFVEYRSKGLKADGILKGGAAPLIGTAVGIVPQCGFSVVATELYGKRKIALGTLLAVYIATSDEALPIMLSSYAGLTKLWPVLIIKVCFALVVGYAAFGIEKIIDKKSSAPLEKGDTTAEHEHEHEHENGRDHEHEHEHGHDGDEVKIHIHGCHHHALESDNAPEGLTKKQKAARVWNIYLKHPLIHTATVILFIFAVNLSFGTAVFYVGEDRLGEFVSSTGYLQPVLSALVGLIPNCASSVVITELYVVGGLNLGGAVAGLCVSAGIGYAVLVKDSRSAKNTALIICLMYVLSVALGVGLTACGF